ncbi:MAG: DUF1786 domain-containing protein, partial [Thermomicrobiales bacterium]
TQDILIYEPGRPIENSEKLVLPSQTQIVAKRIRTVTESRRPLHLTGRLMGGGASTDAIAAHVSAGLPVTATADAARTIHNRPERVLAAGVTVVETAPEGARILELGDFDGSGMRTALEQFGIDMPATVALAVQDHGYRPGFGNNDVRFDYLQSLLDNGGELSQMIFRSAPEGMTRKESLLASVPGAFVMDTGAAAVLGVLGDPIAGEAVRSDGAVIVNIGNMHTFAALVRGERLFGLFEHHSGGMSAPLLQRLVTSLQSGELDPDRFAEEFDGHGAAFDRSYATEGPFPFVAVTGPNRGLARSLGYYEAAPFGDMMLTGSFGLVEGVLRARSGGTSGGIVSLLAESSPSEITPHHHP